MSINISLILIPVAFATSFIAGLLGMGGGIVLLSVLHLFFSLKDVIPMHSLVQTVSNTSRFGLFFKYIHWPVVWRFLVLAAPGIYLGGLVWRDMNPGLLQILVGAFIIFSMTAKKFFSKLSLPLNGFFILGFFGGFLGAIVGALGPLIAPFFHHSGLIKERFVATKAACQSLVHLMKTFSYWYFFGFNYMERMELLIPLSIAAILGTYTAKKVIKKIPDEIFIKIFRASLATIGILMITSGVNELF